MSPRPTRSPPASAPAPSVRSSLFGRSPSPFLHHPCFQPSPDHVPGGERSDGSHQPVVTFSSKFHLVHVSSLSGRATARIRRVIRGVSEQTSALSPDLSVCRHSLSGPSCSRWGISFPYGHLLPEDRPQRGSHVPLHQDATGEGASFTPDPVVSASHPLTLVRPPGASQCPGSVGRCCIPSYDRQHDEALPEVHIVFALPISPHLWPRTVREPLGFPVRLHTPPLPAQQLCGPGDRLLDTCQESSPYSSSLWAAPLVWSDFVSHVSPVARTRAQPGAPNGVGHPGRPLSLHHRAARIWCVVRVGGAGFLTPSGVRSGLDGPMPRTITPVMRGRTRVASCVPPRRRRSSSWPRC